MFLSEVRSVMMTVVCLARRSGIEPVVIQSQVNSDSPAGSSDWPGSGSLSRAYFQRRSKTGQRLRRIGTVAPEKRVLYFLRAAFPLHLETGSAPALWRTAEVSYTLPSSVIRRWSRCP